MIVASAMYLEPGASGPGTLSERPLHWSSAGMTPVCLQDLLFYMVSVCQSAPQRRSQEITAQLRDEYIQRRRAERPRHRGQEVIYNSDQGEPKAGFKAPTITTIVVYVVCNHSSATRMADRAAPGRQLCTRHRWQPIPAHIYGVRTKYTTYSYIRWVQCSNVGNGESSQGAPPR